MEKVLLAVGHRQVEDYINAKAKGEYTIVGTTVYREGVLKAIKENKPDVIVLFESLKGNENISEIIYEIRANYKNVRIIFGSNKREPGDVLLATIVGYGIYDILYGEKINANEIIRLIKDKNEFTDVFHLRPKTTVDEKTNKKLYDVPTKVVERPVIKEIYLDKTNPFDESIEDNKIEASKEKDFSLEEVIDKNSSSEEVVEKISEDEIINLDEEKIPDEDEIINLEESESFEKGNSLDDEIFNLEEDKKELIEEPVMEKKQNLDEKSEEQVKKLTENLKGIKEDKVEKVGFFARLIGTSKDNKKENDVKDVPEVEKIVSEPEVSEPKIPEPVIVPIPQVETIIPEPKIIKETVIKETIMPVHMKQKILTFLGSEQGVGNSQIAFNTALHLARSGFRTMYIDFKETGSTAEYLYQLGTFEKGLDIALRGMENKNYTQIENSIISMSSIISNTPKSSMMLKNYKQFPDLLDLLFYSEDYVTRKEKERINSTFLKDLFMYFIIQKNYDFIVLDAPSDLKNEFTEISMAYSTKIFLTLTQDVSHIGGWLRKIPELTKRINLDKKIYYIINKYEKAELNQRDISEWMKVDIPITIPSLNKDFINANYIGLPVLLYSKNKELKKAFASIEKIIFE
ncbi:ParA family protein [Bacillus thuringiensis]|uniref:AAA family ATPase n=1 Tax=Bacillus thuringiensis TaxID=1428 RepID=UPI0011A45230|nr:ParA family protein [Bacillus thuringiensis]